MAVTPDDVRHVASLARLGIPEAALAKYVEQINGILSHMDALQRVPAGEVGDGGAGDGGAGDGGAGDVGMPLREDRVASVPLAVAKERFAPQMREGFFLVPRLATHEDAGDAS